MTIYISQGRYTAAAIKGMSAKPEDRSEAVAELFAAAGARLISWYLTLGPYDWLIIAEAPDEPTMISAVLAAAAGGSLSDISMKERRPAFRTVEGWARSVLLEAGAIRECEEHGWMRDRADPHARGRAFELARRDPPPDVSPEEASPLFAMCWTRSATPARSALPNPVRRSHQRAADVPSPPSI